MSAAAQVPAPVGLTKSAIQRRIDTLVASRTQERLRAENAERRVQALESQLGEAGEHWRGYVPAFSDPDRRMFETKIVQLEATVARSLNLLRQYRELLHRRTDAR
jgi:hypothetical protein